MRTELFLSCAFLVLQLANGALPELPITLQGRFSPGPDKDGTATLPQTFSWGASSVYVSFTGASSVTVTLSATLPTNYTYGMSWLRFFVDGVAVKDAFTSYKQTDATAQLQTTTGPHTLRVTKLSDPSKGEVSLNSITLNSGSFTAVNQTASLASSRRLLILGDSYAVGYGNAGAVLPNSCVPTVSQLSEAELGVCTAMGLPLGTECADYIQFLNGNALEAFGPVTADAFDADYQVLATSGMVGYSYAVDAHPDLSQADLQKILPSNALLFNQSLFSGGQPPNFSAWQPQVVVVASGTNDWHSLPPIYTLKSWVDQAIQFLQQISTTYNRPAIIIQAWPGEQQFAGALKGGKGVNETIQYLEGMPALYSEAVARKIPNVYLLQLTTENYDNLYTWCDGHPSAVADKAVAQQLASFIDAVVPAWNITSQVSLNVNQDSIRPDFQSFASSPPAVAASG